MGHTAIAFVQVNSHTKTPIAFVQVNSHTKTPIAFVQVNSHTKTPIILTCMGIYMGMRLSEDCIPC